MTKNHLSDDEKIAARRAYEKEWHAKNPGKNKEYKKNYYRRNREKVLARSKDAYYRDVEETRVNKALWRKGLIVEARINTATRRATHPELQRVYVPKNERPNRAYWHWQSCRYSAGKKEVSFTLTVEWFQSRLDAGVCEMTGLAFDMKAKRGRNTPSVDRRDPKGNYTVENCRMVLWSLNHGMSNHGEEYIFDVFRRAISTYDAKNRQKLTDLGLMPESRSAYAGM